jgi:hypothetical protein|nr:MAG TPA: hypothetical protein [Crassvirales sp.]
MMKIINLIACLPMIAIGVAIILLTAIADNAYIILAIIGLWIASIDAILNYSYTCKRVIHILKAWLKDIEKE